MNENLLMFNTGSLSCDGITFAEPWNLDSADFELSDKEQAPLNLHLSTSQSVEFSATTSYINMDLLQQMITPLESAKTFIMEQYIPIMIQARWHKKARVRKKWLKRYGMKPDRVKVHLLSTTVDFNYHDNSVDLKDCEYERILRSDQKRRGIKIEWI